MGPARTWDQYAIRWAGLHGGVDPRGGAGFMRGWMRAGYRTAALLVRLRVKPSLVTTAGIVLCLTVPVVAARRGAWPLLAAVLVVLAAMADSVDGAVAIISNRVTRMGYVYDSVADRIGEACWLVAWWRLGAPGWLVATCGAVAWLHEYLRARAAAAGMAEVGVLTMAERPTRALLVVIGLALAGISSALIGGLLAGTVTVLAAIWVLLGLIGLAQLAVAVRASFAHRRP